MIFKLKDIQLLVLFSLFIFLSCEKELKPIMDFSNPDDVTDSEDIAVPKLEESKRPILICEQSQGRVIIVDSLSQGIMWEWKASTSSLPTNQTSWFTDIDEAKAVYNKEYVLVTASSGGAALIRISDKKIMFYTNAKGNPHSAEVLPDGNIIVACSTSGTVDGDALKIYRVNPLSPYVENETIRYPLLFAHNAVWDKERNVLWATDKDFLYSYTYNNNFTSPELIRNSEVFPVPDSSPHDLFPVFGEDALYLTAVNGIYKFDLSTKDFAKTDFSLSNVKSISSGPAGFGTLLLKPTESHWSSQVINSSGKIAFNKTGYKIYKARWFINNTFSYPSNHEYPTN